MKLFFFEEEEKWKKFLADVKRRFQLHRYFVHFFVKLARARLPLIQPKRWQKNVEMGILNFANEEKNLLHIAAEYLFIFDVFSAQNRLRFKRQEHTCL